MNGQMTLKIPLRDIGNEYRQFRIFYSLKKDGRKYNPGRDLLKIFYFSNNDELVFKSSRDLNVEFYENEIIYRNNLRQKISEYFKFGFKIREWEMLMLAVYKDKDPSKPVDKNFLDASFYGRKIMRYSAFAKNICDFCLSMVHAYYWEDFIRTIPSEKTLKMCVEEVFPFVEKVKDMFEKDLEEEFDTSDIEKELGIGKENKKLAVTSTVDMPPLKVSKK